MKTLHLLFFLTYLTFQGFSQNYRSNCSVFPLVNTQTLPDGSKLTLTSSGNEMISYLETLEGFTVIKNQNGFFEYAMNDIQGNLVVSGLIAKNETFPSQKNLKIHSRYSSSQLDFLNKAFDQNNVSLSKKAGGKPFPSKGKRKVLTILIQYPDLPAIFAKSNFDSLMVKPNYNGTGSFRDYYLKSSYGQLELSTDVFGWFVADSGYLYYGKSNPNYIGNVGKLIRKAILAADSAGVDFSQYDNDKDGYVDGIIIMHSGIGAEEQSAPSANNFIWSHRFNLSNTAGSVLVDGVTVDAYGCFPEKRYSNGNYSQVGIGVISHEFGHLLDLPDLYATNSLSEGSGNYANMAGGPWLNNERTPCIHDSWSRIQLGWMTPVLINSVATFTLPKSLADSNFSFRINTPVANEYFLLENRQKKGFDKYLPSHGLAVWHINSNKAKLLSQASGNNVNNDTSNYGVALIQADGRFDLEKGNNRGDGGDLYPGTTNNHNLTPFTSPATTLNYKQGGIKLPSNIIISNITQNSDSSITFTVGNKPSAGFTSSALSGCIPLTVTFHNGSAFSTNYLWRFSDGSVSNKTHEIKTFDSAGNFPVTLYVLDSANKVIDSVTQVISVAISPTARYQLIRDDSNNFSFKNLSSNFAYVLWQFGSNQTSTAEDPVYKLSSSGKVPFKLIAYSQNGCSDTVSGSLDYWSTGIKEIGALTNLYAYPNPFTDEIRIQFKVAKKGEISLSLYDVLGARVEDLYQGIVEEGENNLLVKSKIQSQGIYLLEIKGSDFKKILRVIHQ